MTTKKEKKERARNGPGPYISKPPKPFDGFPPLKTPFIRTGAGRFIRRLAMGADMPPEEMNRRIWSGDRVGMPAEGRPWD